MKKLSWLNKMVYLFNSLVAFFLLVCYALPYISPKSYPSISVFSLAVPLIIVLNILFMLYWLLGFKRQFLLSFFVLALGFNSLSSLFRIGEKKVFFNDDFKVMSFNARLFDLYKWKTEGKKETLQIAKDFIHDKDPDIICFQEYLTGYNIDFDGYKYRYVQSNPQKHVRYFGMAIYSKHKIIKKGSINFKGSANNAIFADVVRDTDTVRVYNVHLESQHIDLEKENLGQENSDKLFQRFKKTFEKQADQVAQLIEHQEKSPYKIIMMGDFNNTAFSWAYKQLRGDKIDAFKEAGSGFGRTYDFILPARIDFILVDPTYTVNNFKTYHKFEFSDHFPIMARLNTTDTN